MLSISSISSTNLEVEEDRPQAGQIYPPASEANLTERQNPHTPVYGVKEFVDLSVIKFDPNYFRTGKTE